MMVIVFAFCDSFCENLNIIAALKKLFLLRAEEKQLFRQKLKIRSKKPGWSNHTARGSG